MSGPRETLTSSNNDVAYSLLMSASKIFRLNMDPGSVFNSLFITQSFVFPFLGFPSIIDSPSDPRNLNLTSDTIPSEILKVTIPFSEILSGPLILTNEYIDNLFNNFYGTLLT